MNDPLSLTPSPPLFYISWSKYLHIYISYICRNIKLPILSAQQARKKIRATVLCTAILCPALYQLILVYNYDTFLFVFFFVVGICVSVICRLQSCGGMLKRCRGMWKWCRGMLKGCGVSAVISKKISHSCSVARGCGGR